MEPERKLRLGGSPIHPGCKVSLYWLIKHNPVVYHDDTRRRAKPYNLRGFSPLIDRVPRVQGCTIHAYGSVVST